MKTRIKLSVVAVLTFFTLFMSCSNDDDFNSKEVLLTDAEIPSEIKAYIQMHFSTNSIIRAEKETELNAITYDVNLSGNVNLEFDSAYSIIDIDSATSLPNSVIPQSILDYVTANYPSNFITDWELELNHQQVQLNDGIELEFGMNGDFIRVDND